MYKDLLPGEGDNFLGEVEVVGKEFLAFIVDEVIEVLPAEDKFDVSSVFKGSHDFTKVDVGNSSSLMWLCCEIFMHNNDSFLKNISVDCFFLGF